MTLPPLGVQPNIFREMTKESPGAVLDHVVEAGFQAVEIGPIAGHDVPSLLAARGLRACGPHTMISSGESTGEWMAFCEATGAQDVCTSGLLRWGGLSVDDYLRGAEELNRRGEQLRRQEIHLHYHHHGFEFERLAGELTGMEFLLQHLDPGVVDICVDVGWMVRSGKDPVAFLEEHGRRVGYLHLKDYRPPEEWCPLGTGTVDWDGVWASVRKVPSLRWLVVEQDRPVSDAVAELKVSRAFLRSELGV
ncbi:MAG: sugar phosphate isomerase/epimerase [Verrucomicrobiia bacterium]